jgi:hypothetical protein
MAPWNKIYAKNFDSILSHNTYVCTMLDVSEFDCRKQVIQ